MDSALPLPICVSPKESVPLPPKPVPQFLVYEMGTVIPTSYSGYKSVPNTHQRAQVSQILGPDCLGSDPSTTTVQLGDISQLTQPLWASAASKSV